MKDKYDEQIERLCGIADDETRSRNTFYEWDSCKGIFQTANPSGNYSGPCGCLTQIRHGDYDGPNAELTQAIRADDRIPRGLDALRSAAYIGGKAFREALEACKEWQRRLDREIRGAVR